MAAPTLVEVADRGQYFKTWVFSSTLDIDAANEQLGEMLVAKSYIVGIAPGILIFHASKDMTSSSARQSLLTTFRKSGCEVTLGDVSTFTGYHAELLGFKEMPSNVLRTPVPEVTWLPNAPTELVMPKTRRLSVPLMLEWVFLRAGCVRGNGLRNEPDAEMWPEFCSSYVEICHIKNVPDARREAQKAFLEHCKNRGFEWTKSDLEEAELPEAEDGKCLKCGKEKPKRTDLVTRYNEEPIMSNLGPIMEKWGLDMQSGNLF
jgi:hypothetical protein